MEKDPPRESKKNTLLVEDKRTELSDYIATHWDEIVRRERIILFLDECFLLWGDACGYVWSKRGERCTLPIGNIRTRQPYYGAVDLMSGRMHGVPYEKADACSTTDFLLDLQGCYPDTKLTIIWDNASHHKAADVRAYLAEVNAGQTPEEWVLTCLWFAPHDPSQNPVEDIWNQAKAFVRQQWTKLTQFLDVKRVFEQFLGEQVFDFPKLHRYCPDL